MIQLVVSNQEKGKRMTKKIDCYDTLLEMFPEHKDAIELYFSLAAGSDLEKAHDICYYYCGMDFWQVLEEEKVCFYE